jgi:hypothetical protein
MFRLLEFSNVYFVGFLDDRHCLGHCIKFFDIQFDYMDRSNRFPQGVIQENMSNFHWYLLSVCQSKLVSLRGN